MQPDRTSYAELTAKIKNLSANSFELGGMLSQMSRERHYQAADETGEPRYATFEEFCEGELRKTKSHAYALMRAHEVYEALRENGCEPLPIDPFTVRSLSRLKDEDQIVTAWEQACSQKKSGRLPSQTDVAREVRRILPIPARPTSAGRKAAKKYSALVLKATKEMRQLMSDLDFQQLRRAKDSASKAQKAELAAKVQELFKTSLLHYLALSGQKLPTSRTAIMKPKGFEFSTGKKGQSVKIRF